MRITDVHPDPQPVLTKLGPVPFGTVFTGLINGIAGPWLRLPYGVVNLREVDKSLLSLPDTILQTTNITNYRNRPDHELILR